MNESQIVGLTQSDIDLLVDNLPPAEAMQLLELLSELETRQHITACQNDLMAFVMAMQPDYKMGPHLHRLYGLLSDVESGAKDRLLVNAAPRFGKSLAISQYFPAWYIGKNPKHKLIIASHTADLAVDMLRKVRNLMQTAEYKRIFPGVEIAMDAKAAGKWDTTAGGSAYAVGVGGALAGRGANILIVDDPFSEQDVINGNYEVFEKVYQWYAYGARTRLMPEGKVAILHTRWSQADLTARLLKDAAQNPQADQFELFEFPAILNIGTPEEKSLWPEQWPLEALLRTKASMPTFQWNAQYMQQPTNADSGIVPKGWFKVWERERPPAMDFIIMSLDAAVEANKRSDFNALITAGVFFNEETDRNEVVLLNALNFRAEFPELKDRVTQEYQRWEPDSFIIEAKANGAPLIQEFRKAGVYVQPFVPHRGTGDKIMRLNSVADIIRDGALWVPQTRWAEEIVDQVTAMPAGANDDLVDALVMLLIRFRQGGFLSLSTDEPDTQDYSNRPKRAYY